MPFYVLKLRAALEGVSEVGVEEDFAFRVRFACGCGNTFEKASVFGWGEEAEVPGGTGTATFVQKCKECGRVGSVDLTSKPADFRITAEDSEKPVRVATFECRGFEPRALEVADGFRVRAAAGATEWRRVDLSEAAGEHAAGWNEYDEAADAAASVTDVSATFARDKEAKKR